MRGDSSPCGHCTRTATAYTTTASTGRAGESETRHARMVVVRSSAARRDRGLHTRQRRSRRVARLPCLHRSQRVLSDSGLPNRLVRGCRGATGRLLADVRRERFGPSGAVAHPQRGWPRPCGMAGGPAPCDPARLGVGVLPRALRLGQRRARGTSSASFFMLREAAGGPGRRISRQAGASTWQAYDGRRQPVRVQQPRRTKGSKGCLRPPNDAPGLTKALAWDVPLVRFLERRVESPTRPTTMPATTRRTTAGRS